MIFDGTRINFHPTRPNHISVPLEELAIKAGKSKIMVNSVATGAALACLGFEIQPLLDRLSIEFRNKGNEIVANNRESALAGYRYFKDHFKGVCPHTIPFAPATGKKMMLTGSQAMALGAICAGVKFYAGYPMSPSTPIMEFIASMAKDYGIVLEPAEDEIAAINMAIGASFAGARAMTATSGGGFCLMVEGLGLAGMTETPVVVVVAQRPGPSTGLPTRTEQADLRFVIHAAHGEFPRAVFAPGNVEQAFSLMGKAFNMADRYQTPVIVLGDQHLNDSYFTVDKIDLGRVNIDRGEIVAEGETVIGQGLQEVHLARVRGFSENPAGPPGRGALRRQRRAHRGRAHHGKRRCQKQNGPQADEETRRDEEGDVAARPASRGEVRRCPRGVGLHVRSDERGCRGAECGRGFRAVASLQRGVPFSIGRFSQTSGGTRQGLCRRAELHRAVCRPVQFRNRSAGISQDIEIRWQAVLRP